VTCDHALLDGRGLFSLLDALLQEHISDLPYESITRIPRLEETLNVIPDAFFLLDVVYKQLVVPKLPRFIQPYLGAPPSWPAGCLKIAPNRCFPLYTLLDLPYDLIKSLKTAGRLHDVLTVHPTFKLSYAIAVWSVVGRPQQMTLQSPISVRDKHLGHSHCTACYVSSMSVTLSPIQQTDFWHEAARIGVYMSSSDGRRQALQTMGTLSLIPDAKMGPSESQPTGWEQFLFDKMDNKRITESIGISNIGHVELPAHARDLCWGQAASPLSTPFEISVVGHSAGLRVMGSYREGFAVSAEEINQVNSIWEFILRRLADPEWTDFSLGGLVSMH
jgi:hypothetical protein